MVGAEAVAGAGWAAGGGAARGAGSVSQPTRPPPSTQAPSRLAPSRLAPSTPGRGSGRYRLRIRGLCSRHRCTTSSRRLFMTPRAERAPTSAGGEEAREHVGPIGHDAVGARGEEGAHRLWLIHRPEVHGQAALVGAGDERGPRD